MVMLQSLVREIEKVLFVLHFQDSDFLGEFYHLILFGNRIPPVLFWFFNEREKNRTCFLIPISYRNVSIFSSNFCLKNLPFCGHEMSTLEQQDMEMNKYSFRFSHFSPLTPAVSRKLAMGKCNN
ncbi:hypothetical protein NC652_041372 [Populus alba x Populus x berolinensis]|nr:hypothetical protein NC652_041372 [Populus alba x Populus x berolinensis]